MATRRPRGYLGINHVTRGEDILAVMETMLFPELTLGAEMVARLREVRVDGWYPIGDLLELLERIDQKLGTFHLKQVGWTIFRKYHAAKARKAFSCARELLEGFDNLYHGVNHGESIGGWKVLSFTARSAEMEKTTPHHCLMEEGILEEALGTIGVSARVSQIECFRKGADACRYLIQPVQGSKRWSRD